MWNISKTFLAVLLSSLPLTALAQTNGVWTLSQCIDYAVKHNVQLLKSAATEQSASVDVVEAKAGLLPSLSGSMTQGVSYRPFQTNGGNYVNGGIATSAADKATQSGSYGINAEWVVWNGKKNKMSISNAQYSQQMAAYDTQTSANKIKEEIAQLYVQILYMTEAEKVNRKLLEQDSIICERGKQMVSVGSMSKADLSQLESQVSQERYNIVNVQTQIADAKMQLKQLIELPANEAFDVQQIDVCDTEVLSVLPTKDAIYAAALSCRPEVKRSQLAIEQSQLATKIAKSGYMPTVSLTGGLGDSHMTGSNSNWAKQMKNNFSGSLGVSVTIPIFDNRKNKSAVERAKVAETTAQLDLQDTQKQLYQTIETYWLNASNSQAKYVAAKSNVESILTSYDLMTEQFKLGLKNIAELLNSRSNLLNAQQTMLQDKYTALLNRNLLSFYGGEDLK